MNGTTADGLQTQIEAAMQAVRAAPQAIQPRMALFQLAAVTGDWKRARTQVETIAKLDEEAAMFGRIYGRLIDAEAARERVFAGTERAVALGEPTPWLAMLAQALELDGRQDAETAAALRRQALEAAAAQPGELDGERFTWMMDADPRLGPTLEVVVEGQYRWLPLERIRELRAGPPSAMRDLVWQPVELTLANGTELHVFVPARYPGSAAAADDAVRLASVTTWLERPTGEQWGLGQRLMATDIDDKGFLDIRRIRFDEAAPPTGSDG